MTGARAVNRWLEPAFAALIAGGLGYAMWHLYTYSYLPQPFFYEPADLWADWFNVAYWAYDPGTYDTYGALYPPLTFVFLRLVSLPHCYPLTAGGLDSGTGLNSRTCDWLGLGVSHLIFVVNIVLVARIYMREDRRTAPWRAYALCAGFPMLEALERNNLMITAFTCFVLAFGPLVRSARARWLWAALAINFKVYVIAAVIPHLLRRRWRWVEGVLIATAVVYLVTYAILGRGTPAEIYRNITQFAAGGAATFTDVWFPATFLALQALLNNWQSPVMGLVGSRNVHLLLVLLPALQRIVQTAIVAAAAMTWLRPEAVTRARLTNLGIGLALVTSESGGYSVILVFFLTFLERWEGIGRKWAIIAAYILCVPLDIPLDKAPEIIRDTFLPGSTVIASYSVMLGPFIRPLFFYSIPFALSCVTIRQVWGDIRAQGWRGRWRYRRDLPVMVGNGTARAPGT